MTYDELKDLIKTLDPHLSEWFFIGEADSYTVITPHGLSTLMSDDAPEMKLIQAQIDRYTNRIDEDDFPDLLEALMDEHEVYFEEQASYYDEANAEWRTIFNAHVMRGKD